MARRAIILDQNVHGTTIIAVDLAYASEILSYVFSDSVDKEFNTIRGIIKQGLRIKDKYCKCDVSKKADNMFEMRFTNCMRNARIYCQEIRRNQIRYVVMCELLESKKSQDIPLKIRSRIEIMGGYEYEIK